MPERRDRLGRRIGRNWWREMVMEAFDAAWFHVEQHREDNHQMEPEDFAVAYPLPRLKDFLIRLAGQKEAA